MGAMPRLRDTAQLASELDARYAESDAQTIIQVAIDLFRENGGIAAISSFGADSAVLLHLIANVDATLPILFLDTGQHFGETFEYRDQLSADLGLTNIVNIEPLATLTAESDPDKVLHKTDPDLCCSIRKVEPMARAVEPYAAWFTGRKRHQAQTRAAMPVFESVSGRIRINPLATWTTSDQADYMRRHNLRENPLVAFGYYSIGCFPCTQPVKPGEDSRSGRWAGAAKTECGIHLTGLENALPPTRATVNS